MVTAFLDNWTEMNCIQLIREFRARPMLWDQKDPFYYKKSMKPELWEEIGEKLKMPALECKHKMNILLSSFRREKAKIMHKIEENNGDTSNMMCASSWFAINEMMFLMDKDTERKRQQMGADNPDNEIDDHNEITSMTSSLKRTLLKHHIQPPISNKKRPRFSDLLQDVAKQSSSTTTITPTPLRQPEQVATSSTETDDEIKSFANFISFKMKKYSESTKNAVQQAICDVIFKADQNFYENDRYIIVDERDPFAKNVGLEDDSNKKIKEEYDMVCYIDEDSE